MDYIFHILILVNIYIIISISLNLIAGYCGLISLTHAAFFGIGAYSTGLLWYFYETNFFVGILASIIISAFVGVVVAYPALRIIDDYFIVVTFSFQIVAHSILKNWNSFTQGPLGIVGIPKPSILGYSIESHIEYLILTILFVFIIYFFINRLVKSPFGLILKGIREDEIFTKAGGKNINKYKILVFIIGGIIASVAGVLYAHYISYIDPSSFTINESIFILSIIIIGGLASVKGSVLGALILILLPELLRFIGISSAALANIRQVVYGLLLIIFMIYRPRGFVGEYELGKVK